MQVLGMPPENTNARGTTAMQVGGWAVSSVLRTDKLFDMLGTGTFALLAGGSLALSPGPITPRKVGRLCYSDFIGLQRSCLCTHAPLFKHARPELHKIILLSFYISHHSIYVVKFLRCPAAMHPQIMVSAMVGSWAARLGSYLVARVHKVGKDSRFDEVKHQPGVFLL
jgi:hypothetical protein